MNSSNEAEKFDKATRQLSFYIEELSFYIEENKKLRNRNLELTLQNVALKAEINRLTG